MSWSHSMAKEYYNEEAMPMQRLKTQRRVRVAYGTEGSVQVDCDDIAHIVTRIPLDIGEVLENNDIRVTVTGTPGPTTWLDGWVYQVYKAKVEFLHDNVLVEEI